MRARTPLDKRQRERLERFLEDLVDIAATGNAAPADWQADEVERILNIPHRDHLGWPLSPEEEAKAIVLGITLYPQLRLVD